MIRMREDFDVIWPDGDPVIVRRYRPRPVRIPIPRPRNPDNHGTATDCMVR